MEFKIKQEISNLMKAGVKEEFAILIATSKYGALDQASEVIASFSDENQVIKEEMEQMGFQPFEVQNTDALLTVTYSNTEEQEEEKENKVEELSCCIVEEDDKNEIKNF
jgi:hypothetical protein